jgi:signal transduction histidine kinase/DNA-binding response OmpR family regulator
MHEKTDKYEKKIQQLENELNSFQAAVEELKVLNEIAVAAGKTTNVDQTLKLILDKTVKAVNAEHGSILLVAENQETLKTFIKQTSDSKISKIPHIGEHINGWTLINKKSLIIKNLSKDQRFKATEEEKKIVRSLICSPIWFEGKIIGVLQMINKKSAKDSQPSFNDNDLTLLSIISVQAGQLIKNSELQHLNYAKEKAAEVAKLEAEKLQEVDKLKTNFFTNISHEFRTPLTLILGPLEKLMNQKKYNEDQIELVYKNANRLLKLINQLLDLSSIEAGKMKLNLSKGEIISFIKGMISSFQPLAEIKNINLIFNPGFENLNIYFDRDKLEKIISNLLINAIKFTNNGQIIISVSDELKLKNNSRYLEITIEDTGTGIAADKIETIFERFFTDNNETEQTGTGIGLALVKELIELHHGFISVESKLHKGSNFKIELPVDEEYYKDSGIKISEERGSNNEMSVEERISEKPPGEELPLILLIEDNEDIRKFLKDSLVENYRLLESNNGRNGLESASQKIPDLVISDVLMPEMNGIELCEKLKTDERTSHIPVVLLTSRSATENKIEGLGTGADDYITKPFSIAELRARVNNLIIQRRNLRKRYRKELIFDARDLAVTSTDEKFLNRVFQTIELHISDYNFTVEEFAKEIGLSRMQLHRKIHALTDQSANELIRSYRLKKAVRLLAVKSGNISEVAYEVGFSNPSYFASSFKDLFGYSPSEYLQNLNSIQEQ